MNANKTQSPDILSRELRLIDADMDAAYQAARRGENVQENVFKCAALSQRRRELVEEQGAMMDVTERDDRFAME